MVNIDDFVKRLEIILDYYTLNASAFADKIGVQRSSMSHLLSGRNKPSLDFVMKIMEVFPEVDLYWILNGQGSFPKVDEKDILKKTESVSEFEKTVSPILLNENSVADDLFSTIHNDEEINLQNKKQTDVKISTSNFEEAEIEKIVFFYTNGTFKVYNP